MIRDLSKYARRVALGAMTALALLAGSAVNTTPANACGVGGGNACMTELGIDKKPADYLKGAAVGVIAYKWGQFFVEAIASCEGILGFEKVDCTKATVASAAELQSDRFAQFGIDPTKAAMTASAVDLGAQTRAALIASYAGTQGPQYALAH